MLKVVICDDDKICVQQIKDLLEEYKLRNPDKSMRGFCFYTSSSLLADMDINGCADIYILDIYIDQMDGLEVARRVRSCSSQSSVVFLTRSDGYALDAFAVGAAHYLTKPVRPEAFFEALDRCFAGRKNKVKMMRLRSEKALVSLNPSDILYAQAKGDSKGVTTKKEVLPIRMPLLELYETLREYGPFIMPHRSYIINLDAVHKITSEEIIMNDGHALPMPRGLFRQIRQQFIDHAFQASGETV